MYIVRIVQRLAAAPDHRERRRQVARLRRVPKLHCVAVNGVAQQLRIDARHPALDVELAHEPRLHDELADDVHLHLDRFLGAGRHQNLRAVARHIDGGTEDGTRSVARSDAADARHEDVVATVLGGVVRASVRLDAPVARELGRDAARAREMRRAVEEGEVGGHEIGTGGGAHRQFGGEVVCVCVCVC